MSLLRTHTELACSRNHPAVTDRTMTTVDRGVCALFFFFFWFKSGGVCLGGGGLRLCAPWGEGSSQGCRLNKHAGSERARIECFSLELSGGRQEESFYFQHFKPQTSVVPIFTQRTHEDLNLIFVIIVCVCRHQSFNMFPPSLPSK